MAPEKDSKAGHSADSSHAVSQWVVATEIEIGSTECEMVEDSPPKKVKRRPPRKQQLSNRMLAKEPEIMGDIPIISKKQRKRMNFVDKEVSRLEQLVFGDASSQVNSLEIAEVGMCEEVVTSLEREWSREGNSAAAALEELDQKPVWIDEEDQSITVQSVMNKGLGKRYKSALPASASTDTYGSMLHRQYEDLVGTPKWARLDLKQESNEDGMSDLSRHCGDILAKSSRTLAPTLLKFARLADLTEKGVSKRTIITAVDFHPKMQAAVVANRPGLATFYQVDGEQNTRIQSVMFENFPISSAKFLPDGSELLIGSEYRSHMQSYDMETGRALHIPCPVSGPEIASMSNFCLSSDGKLMSCAGRDGTVILMTAHTREWIGSVKMSGKCHALSFSEDGSRLLTYGKEGQVYIWDVGQRSCIHRFHDEGCIQGLSLAISSENRYMACGSGSGVVNIYHGNAVLPVGGKLSETPRPAKAIMNLTTAAHQVTFNPSAQLLATVSRCKDSAVKLVHLPSMTVYANFPSKALELARPEVVAFSPNGGYIAIGNNIGAVRLFRLEHFTNY